MKDRTETLPDATPDNASDDMDETYYTPKRVGEIVGVTSTTVRDWIKTGKLPAVRIGTSGRFRVKRSDLVKILSSKYGPVET